MPFDDDSFDVVVSVNTLEHVPLKKRRAFFAECNRVSRKGSVYIFPVGKYARQIEDIKKKAGHNHPCAIQKVDKTLELLPSAVKSYKVEEVMTCREHLWCLAMAPTQLPRNTYIALVEKSIDLNGLYTIMLTIVK